MLCYSRFAHARYGSQMIGRFLYWGDHRNQKSGAIKGSCHPSPLSPINWCAYMDAICEVSLREKCFFAQISSCVTFGK